MLFSFNISLYCSGQETAWCLLNKDPLLFRLLISVLVSNCAGSSLVYSDLVYKITCTRDRNLAVLFFSSMNYKQNDNKTCGKLPKSIQNF